ncbi:nucleic acid dioxygenase ALKBH1 [Nematostella vectensis]|uniref:nucleic acid dioxygenase ALKBH1 n=1 Tax=Nematostella vectensis TaxID=45351 RepID=UPI0020772773|nr:nucleic acid dioxygenase ALKBH1 [Nematostella vectensis]
MAAKTSQQFCSKPDLIRQEYKRYKRKKPPPDFSEVIDFNDPQTFQGKVSEWPLKSLPHSDFGLKCARQWRAYHLDCRPGLIFIVNPFVSGAQHYWARRCLEDFPRKPNISNLDAHMSIGDDDCIWALSNSGSSEHVNLIDRLRWVHLGYQFDYNVVDYKPEKYYGFPKDLGGLMHHLAEAIGYLGYTPEAGIVNYYPLSASMGGHTDHYELDLSWPLISVSFGQSAVFLIGGKTKDVKPTALYIRSGDILVMSGEARLAFHAVPRIIQVQTKDNIPEGLTWSHGMLPEEQKTHMWTTTARSVTTKTHDGEQDTTEQKSYKDSCCNPKAFLTQSPPMTEEEWLPFAKYLSRTRINVNVRQVHSLGTTVNSPLPKDE